jgi:hypothetical protein
MPHLFLVALAAVIAVNVVVVILAIATGIRRARSDSHAVTENEPQ